MTAATRVAALPTAARRTLAIGVLLLALVLAWSLVIAPLGMLATSQDEWRSEVSRQIARDRGIAKSATQLRAAGEVVRNAPIRARLFEPTAIGVDNELQNELRAALLQAGVEPTTFKVLPGKSADGLRQHRVEFSSVMTVDQLRALYAHLSQQPHYVRIERLRVEAPASQRADENPRLTVLMEAQGFALEKPAPASTRVARAY